MCAGGCVGVVASYLRGSVGAVGRCAGVGGAGAVAVGAGAGPGSTSSSHIERACTSDDYRGFCRSTNDGPSEVEEAMSSCHVSTVSPAVSIDAIRDEFGVSVTRFWQLVNQPVSTPRRVGGTIRCWCTGVQRIRAQRDTGRPWRGRARCRSAEDLSDRGGALGAGGAVDVAVGVRGRGDVFVAHRWRDTTTSGMLALIIHDAQVWRRSCTRGVCVPWASRRTLRASRQA